MNTSMPPCEKPIIFSAPMVRAILAGVKTQTRRLVKWPAWADPERDARKLRVHGAIAFMEDGRAKSIFRCPFGWCGDRLWVREAWEARRGYDPLSPSEIGQRKGADVLYLADQSVRYSGCRDHFEWGRTRSPIQMPRWASRITLEVTEACVQRVQDIREGDAIAEWVEPNWNGPGWAAEQEGYKNYLAPEGGEPACTARESFRSRWDSIHGEGAFDRNDYVWAVTFRRVSA